MFFFLISPFLLVCLVLAWTFVCLGSRVSYLEGERHPVVVGYWYLCPPVRRDIWSSEDRWKRPLSFFFQSGGDCVSEYGSKGNNASLSVVYARWVMHSVLSRGPAKMVRQTQESLGFHDRFLPSQCATFIRHPNGTDRDRANVKWSLSKPRAVAV